MNLTALGTGDSHAAALDAALAALYQALGHPNLQTALVVLGATNPPTRVERILKRKLGAA